MKKYLVFLLLFALIAAFIAVPRNISAKGPVPVESEVWEWYGEGVTGEVIPISTTPRNWYQLKSVGLKVDGASKICHGFDDGRYGWTGEIFRLVEGSWVKLPTTVGWVPNEEGHFMACATAPAAGTYALFGFFVKANAPAANVPVPEVLPECVPGQDVASSGYTAVPPYQYSNFHVGFLPVVAGTPVFVEIIPITGSYSGFSSVATFTIPDGSAFVPYPVYVMSTGNYEFNIRFTTPNCYFDLNFTGNIAT